MIKLSSDSKLPSEEGISSWIQVALCHVVMFNTWGLINSFGTFQTYFVTKILPEYSPSTISWIGSSQVFFLFFIGAFTGHLTDLGFFRPLFFTGSLLIVIGLLIASFATEYWQLLVSQGMCVGLGNGFLFCPSLSILGAYFTRKRSLAFGISAAGSATGGMVYSAIFSALLPTVGFSWAMRTAALIQFTCLAICIGGIRPLGSPRKIDKLVDLKCFKDMPYILFTIGIFFIIWGLYFAIHYVSLFATSIIGLSFHESINILIIFNGVGVFGRIFPNILADYYFGSLNTLIFSTTFSAILSFCWIAVTDKEGLYIWVILYGVIGAAVQSLYPAALINLTNNLNMLGTRMGVMFTVISFTALTGPPIAGMLIHRNSGNFQHAQIFSGFVILVGSGFLLASRLLRKGDLLR